jgi:hypothetical protein
LGPEHKRSRARPNSDPDPLDLLTQRLKRFTFSHTGFNVAFTSLLQTLVMIESVLMAAPDKKWV